MPANPSGTNKTATNLQPVTAISATQTVAAATPFDTRGRSGMRFRPIVTAGNGDTNNYFKVQVYGSGQRNGTYVPIVELISGKLYGTTPLTTDVFPAEADMDSLVLPPFLKFIWQVTGTVTLTGYIEVDYRRERTSGAPGRGSLGDTARLV